MLKSILRFFSFEKSGDKTRCSTTAPQLKSADYIVFSTPEQYIRKGFNKVFKEINLPGQTIDSIYEKYKKAHKSGSTRDEQKCLTEALEGRNWSWSLFDKWEQSFAKRDQFPISWEQYRKFKHANSQSPTTLEDALPYFTGKQMKAILSEKKVKGRSKASTVEALRNMMLDNCTLRDVNLQIHSKLENIDSYDRSKAEKEKIRILHGYIGGTIYSIRDSENRKKLPPIFTFTAKNQDECPVGKKFAAAYNQGKIKKPPPFFPGDSTYISSSRLRS